MKSFTAILLAVIVGCSGSSSQEPRQLELGCSVRFNGTQFFISNEDLYDWNDVQLKINYGVIDDGFTLSVPRIGKGQTYSVGALQFAKSDGQRFNPLQYKANKIMVIAETSHGRGYYFGGW